MAADFYYILVKEEERLKKALEGITMLKELYSKSPGIDFSKPSILYTPPESEVFEDYDKHWPHESKVKYAINHLKSGVVDDVAELLSRIDNFNYEKAKIVSRTWLSRLFRAGEIGAEDMGNKYRYFIKEENNKKWG